MTTGRPMVTRDLPVGENILRLRLERDITKSQLCRDLGIQFTALSYWEPGKYYPSLTALCNLAAYFQVTLDELVLREAEAHG